MKEQINFKFLGLDFKIKSYVNQYDQRKRIVVDCVESGKMIKQYIKHKYPNHNFKVWVKTERYSGGSSLRINLSNKDGSPVWNSIYNDIKSFGNTLQLGRFNGMIDMYELDDKVHSTDDGGMEIDFFTKYVFTYNRPPYGTKEYELQEQLELV